MLTIELICNHPPHKCRCKHNTQTTVNREDLTNDLIKYNPGLLKYLGKKVTATVTNKKQEEKIEKQQPYTSIVEEKGLNYCLNNNFVNQQPQEHPTAPPPPQIYLPPVIQIIEQNSPIKERPVSPVKQQKKETSQQKQIKQFHKDLKNQSRYLSDTAFRKYFNRQCFENYGRNNTSNKADGFVYGNYMKTYNINPHTGENLPISEQTFYHALVSGSPEKYALYTQQAKLGLTQQLPAEQNQKLLQASKSLSKQKLNVEKMLNDNSKHNKQQKKYHHLQLKNNTTQHPQSPYHTFSQKYTQPQTDSQKYPANWEQSPKNSSISNRLSDSAKQTHQIPCSRRSANPRL